MLLLLIAVPLIELLVFVEVGLAIGWLLTIALLLGTSMLGVQLMRIQSRAAIDRLVTAVAERRAPGQAAIDGLLRFLGCALLVFPGFVTDAVGALALFPPVRALGGRWITHHYVGRVVGFVAATGRFASNVRSSPPADVDSTAFEDDQRQLDR